MYQTMHQIRTDNPRFFAPDVVEAFESILETSCLRGGFFITSENLPQPPEGEKERRYTARLAVKFTRPDGKKLPGIVNIGATGEYPDKQSAMDAVKAHRYRRTLKGCDLLTEMAEMIDGEHAVSAVASLTQGFTLLVATCPRSEGGLTADIEYDPAFEPRIERRDFSNAVDARKVLLAGENPMDEIWVDQLIEISKKNPIRSRTRGNDPSTQQT